MTEEYNIDFDDDLLDELELLNECSEFEYYQHSYGFYYDSLIEEESRNIEYYELNYHLGEFEEHLELDFFPSEDEPENIPAYIYCGYTENNISTFIDS
jgi:hypothetical protein